MDSQYDSQAPLARFWQWTDFGEKKGWDWIDLGVKLALPIAGILLTFQLGQNAKKEDQARADQENRRIRADKIAQERAAADQSRTNEIEKEKRRKEEMQFERRRQYESQLQADRMAQEREQFEQQQRQLQSIETRRLQQENNQFIQRQQEGRILAEQQYQQTQKTAFAVSQENFRDALLTEYIDQMRHLIIDWDLQKRSPTIDISIVARTITLTALTRLNGSIDQSFPGLQEAQPKQLSQRKRLILQFLYEARLINLKRPNMSLAQADFSNAALSGMNLHGANLSEINLTSADLSGANLKGASLKGATLDHANLDAVVWDEKTIWPDEFNIESARKSSNHAK